MYRYLQYKTADFIDEIFSVSPTTILPQTGEKSQIAHEFDDGSVAVVGVSSRNYFTVELQWAYISPTDHATLMDFWHSESKGAGRRRTFYWAHPLDGVTYTVRFMGPMTSSYFSIGHLQMSSIVLRVEGQADVMVNLPLYDSLDFISGSGVVTFIRAGVATHVDRYGVVVDLASGEPGFDADGLDLPPASTNLLLWSQDFSNAIWLHGGTGTATGGQTAPDGTSTAYLLDDTDAGAGLSYWQQNISVADDNLIRTGAIFLKEGTSAITVIGLYYSEGTQVTEFYTIDWATHTVDDGVIEAKANGWYRVLMPIANNSSGNTTLTYRIYPAGGVASVTGSVYVWGAQLEALPFATPYIPTTTAPVARLGATATFPYAGNFPGSLADKTIIFDVNVIGTKNAYSRVFTSGDLYLATSWATAGDNQVLAVMGSGSQTPATTKAGKFRVGVTYNLATTTLRLYFDGIMVAEDTTASITESAYSTITIGDSRVYCKIKNLRIYNKTLTEAQMLTEYQESS